MALGSIRPRTLMSTMNIYWGVEMVPCRIFAACKRPPKFTWKSEFRQNYRTVSRQQFQISLLGSLASLRTYRHLAAKVGKSKGGGKQWQITPKTLPRMQCARAIPVT